MRLYSVQALPAWEAAKTRGYLTGNHDHQNFDDWPGFARAYQYMCDHMAKTLPHYSGDFPVWAWTVDPRTRGPIEINTYGDAEGYVLLTLEVPDDRFVLSSLDGYHAILNGWYLSRTEAEDEAMHANGRTPSPEEVEASWARIFDLHPTSDDEIAWRGAYDAADVQACIDRVYLHEVISIEIIVFDEADNTVKEPLP